MKTTKIFAMIIFVMAIMAAAPATQAQSKKELSAQNELLKQQIKQQAADIKTLKAQVKELSKPVPAPAPTSSAPANNTTLANSQVPPSDTPPASTTPATDLNEPVVSVSMTMAELMKDPDGAAKKLSTLAKAQKKVLLAQQEYNDAVAGKVPIKPANPGMRFDYKKQIAYVPAKDTASFNAQFSLPDGWTLKQPGGSSR